MRDSAVPAAAWCPVPEIEPGCRTRTSQLSHRLSLFGRTRERLGRAFLAVVHKKRGALVQVALVQVFNQVSTQTSSQQGR